MSFRFVAALTALVLMVLPWPARGQAAAPVSAPTFVVKWNNGLSLESTEGNTKIQLGTLIQADGRFTTDSPSPTADTFLIRRARIILQGRVAKYFELNLLPEFAGSSLVLLDSYIDTKFSSGFRIRTGKSKTPVGLEQLYSDATLPFAERAVATNLMPNRDVGVDVMGDLLGARVSYVAGVRNGVPDGANGDTDTNSSKDLVGRLTVRSGPGGIAIGASHGGQIGTLPSFKSTAQQTFFAYTAGATADGTRDRISPSAFIYYRAFGGYGEYFRNTQDILRAGVTSNIVNTGWQTTVLWAVTGENVSERGVTPRSPFDPDQNAWGALQVAVRYSALTVDSQAFALGLAAAGASRDARAFGISAVWYNTANVKHYLIYERTVFDHDANGVRQAENAIIFRVQVNLAPSL